MTCVGVRWDQVGGDMCCMVVLCCTIYLGSALEGAEEEEACALVDQVLR